MATISGLLEEILLGDAVAREALRAGYLNMSAYAQKIHPKIVSRLNRPIPVASIVVFLSRIRKKLAYQVDYKPVIRIDALSLRTNISEISYEKTKEAVISAAKLNTLLIDPVAFFAITQGQSELAVICDSAHLEQIVTQFPNQPKARYTGLAAITIRFADPEHTKTPNIIFPLISALATYRVNIIETVSTPAELSFVVHSQDTQRAINALSQFVTHTTKEANASPYL
jgi:aspartokinase